MMLSKVYLVFKMTFEPKTLVVSHVFASQEAAQSKVDELILEHPTNGFWIEEQLIEF